MLSPPLARTRTAIGLRPANASVHVLPFGDTRITEATPLSVLISQVPATSERLMPPPGAAGGVSVLAALAEGAGGTRAGSRGRGLGGSSVGGGRRTSTTAVAQGTGSATATRPA